MTKSFKIGNQEKEIGQNIAAFDFDHTLVKPKGGKTFPKTKDDWEWLTEDTKSKFIEYSKTHDIVIITNQSKGWKIDMIKDVLNDIGVDILVIVGSLNNKKPCNQLFFDNIKSFDSKTSFYCGDAAGRESDWSDSDKKFAYNVGIRFIVPEDVFKNEKIFVDHSKMKYTSNTQEMIILVGFPGSGKTTFAENNLVTNGYIRISGDDLKMLSIAEKHIISKNSIVIDRTNPKMEDRIKFINLAKKHNIKVRCFLFKTSIENAIDLNNKRMNETGKKVPKIALYMFRKKYETPTECEVVEINILKN